jgi:hypothetical protein
MKHARLEWATITASVTVACASPTIVTADVVDLIDQQRTVNVMVSVPPCGDPQMDGISESADDFEPFVSEISAGIECPEANAASHAWHESVITPALMSAAGQLQNSAESEVTAVHHSLAFSDYEVTFEVTSPAAFQMTGLLVVTRDAAGNQGAHPTTSVRLTGPDGSLIVDEHVHAKPGESEVSLEIATTGLLSPGIYTYRVNAQDILDAVIPPAAEISASFDVDMHINAAITGDLNGDGVVDGADLLILLGAWGDCDDPNDCPEDLDGNGVVDGADLLILLGNWG